MRKLTPRDGFQHWSWPLPAAWGLPAGARSDDLALWRRLFISEAKRLGLLLQTLGTPLGEPLWLLRRAGRELGAPCRLVASGFHGEEPAGPWGLLRFLQGVQPAALDAVHLSLLPMVNATGFAAGTRFNAQGDNPNRGYTGLVRPSAEGRLLRQHGPTLASVSQHGVLSCHEDVQADKAYLYAFERGTKPGGQAQRLLQANLRHFEPQPDGMVDGCMVLGGMVFNHHDGSFEDWLFGLGATFAFCVETPGLQGFEERVAAQHDMIAAFVSGPEPGP